MDRLTQLLLAAQAGDRSALERFVTDSQADVWKLCRYLGDARDADDLTQETFERAIGALHRYRSDGPARAWLMTIARRVCVDHTRRAQRRRAGDQRVYDHVTSAGGVGTIIQADHGGRVAVEDLLVHLDDDRRAAFVVTQVLGMRYDEAADVLGCPVGTIRSRVARARRDLVALATSDEVAGNGDAEDEETSHWTGTGGPARTT